MKGLIEAALAAPACERLREFYAIGPAQRAAVESFADALAEHAAHHAAPPGYALVPLAAPESLRGQLCGYGADLGYMDPRDRAVIVKRGAERWAEILRWAGADGVVLPIGPRNGLAHIEGDSIVIRLTADACAFAFANDPQAQEPRPPVIDKQQFLRDTFNALMDEREDGSTPLTDVLDRAMVKAWQDGAEGLDHDAIDGVPGSGHQTFSQNTPMGDPQG